MTIYCNNIKKSYPGHNALNGISLQFESNAITGLLGANGAGKSSLIKCLLGLVTADSGVISGLENTSVGYLPELIHLPPSLSAWELVAFACKISSGEGHAEQVGHLLSRVKLNEQHWHKPVRQLSKGMTQRAALAYAIAGSPRWLILDEPMSGLDAVGRRQFLDIFQQLHHQSTGIIICSHIVPDLVRLCDRIIIMHNGSVEAVVPVEQHSMEEAASLESRLFELAGHPHE